MRQEQSIANVALDKRGYDEMSALPPEEIVRTMAVMLKIACDKIDKLEEMVRRMQRLSAAQVTYLNDRIRRTVSRRCEEYRLDENTFGHLINGKIRRDLQREFGGLVKEMSREDYGLLEDWISCWEDTGYLRGLKTRRKE